MSQDTAKPAARYEHPRCATCHRRDHFPGQWQGHHYKAPSGVEVGPLAITDDTDHIERLAKLAD